MIGRALPVIGAETRTYRSSPRSGALSTTGATETTGTGPPPGASVCVGQWDNGDCISKVPSGGLYRCVLIRNNDPFVKKGLQAVTPPKPRRAVVKVAAPAASGEGGAAAPRLRADARRNEEAVLEAAKVVFARSGVDAPIREIATQAGVGLGTLYRRFPTRADLVAVVFRREIDACADAAGPFAAELEPVEALAAWLLRYTRFLATKQGLAAALHSGDSTFARLPDYFRSRFEPVLAGLLTAAAAIGKIRADIAAYDLLRAIGNLSVASGDDGAAHTERMVRLLLDGLRHGAQRPA